MPKKLNRYVNKDCWTSDEDIRVFLDMIYYGVLDIKPVITSYSIHYTKLYEDAVPAQTVNRFCSSGIQSVAIAASMIMCGMQDIVVAGGVESMTEPVVSSASEYLNDWLLKNTDVYMPMGITAENVAERFNISRSEMSYNFV